VVVTFFSADLKVEVEFKGQKYSCAMMEYMDTANSRPSIMLHNARTNHGSQITGRSSFGFRHLKVEIGRDGHYDSKAGVELATHRAPEIAELEGDGAPYELYAGNKKESKKPRTSVGRIFSSFRKKRQ